MTGWTMSPLIDALLDGDQTKSVSEVRRLLDSGVSAERIVVEGIGEAMDRLDGKCTLHQFNLLEIMLVGRAVTGVIKDLFPGGEAPGNARGTVIVASLEGDVHDLGKNILKMILSGRGYGVIDCGKDCPLTRLVDTAESRRAEAVCISGLITTIVPRVKKVREMMDQRGLSHVKVLAGGAALKQVTAGVLKVDFVAETAFDGARYLDTEIAGRL